MRRPREACSVLLALSSLWRGARGHPQCLGDLRVPSYGGKPLAFCTGARVGADQGRDGTCCTMQRDNELARQFKAVESDAEAGKLSRTCHDLLRRVLCIECHPFAQHLYATTDTSEPIICDHFAAEYQAACGNNTYLASLFNVTAAPDPLPDIYCYPFRPATFWNATKAANPPAKAFPNLQDLPHAIVAMVPVPGEASFWAVAQGGLVVEFSNSSTEAVNLTTVVDLTANVKYEASGAEGLLSVALSPNYAAGDKRFWAYYSVTQGEDGRASRISRFTKAATPEETLASEKIILEYTQLYSSHKSGWMGFRNGKLFVTSGDGGSEYDPTAVAQNPDSMLGKVLRLNVLEEETYSGAGTSGPNMTVYATGFRNPWRGSFDRLTGQLWLGDTGQNNREEVNIVKLNRNYGWREWEGTRCTSDAIAGETCNSTYTPPIFEYCHNLDDCPVNQTGSAVIGGYVYRGTKFPALYGDYIFADYRTSQIMRLQVDRVMGHKNHVKETTFRNHSVIGSIGSAVSALAEGADGELYIIQHSFTSPSIIYNLDNCGPACQT